MSRLNYFNTLSMSSKLDQLGRCRFMQRSEFANGIAKIAKKKVVIVGCGAQGLNQGLNMRDSGCDVSYTLRQSAIDSKRASYVNATTNGFKVGTYEELVPTADLVLNLTPDKQHTAVVNALMPMMKQGATLAYSHGFNIVEEGMQVRPDLTVVMVAPKCPGTEVREEYKRGFGVPTLIAVHPENDPNGDGLEIAKAYAAATGGDRAGVLESSFVAEVKSDLMGEQTILCGEPARPKRRRVQGLGRRCGTGPRHGPPADSGGGRRPHMRTCPCATTRGLTHGHACGRVPPELSVHRLPRPQACCRRARSCATRRW